MLLEGPQSEFAWMAMAIPFLIYVFPHLLKHLVPLSCIDSRRNKQIRELERSIVDFRRQLAGINEVQEFALYSKTKRKLNQVLKDLNNFRSDNPSQEARFILVAGILGKLAAAYLFFALLKRIAILLLEYIDFL